MRTRYIPENSEEIEFKEIKAVAYTFMTNNKNAPYAVITYEGRAKKPTFRFRYETEEDRENKIINWVNNLVIRETLKKERKAKAKEKKDKAFKTVKVGDVFVASWGYNMTIVDFYQLIDLKGKTGTFRKIEGETVSGSAGYSGTLKPIKDSMYGEPFKARFNGDAIKVDSNYAYKSDWNKEFYFNRMD